MSQEPKATNPDNVGGLPELPEPIVLSIHGLQSAGRAIKGYTADQMRAYGELCRAAPAGGDAERGKVDPAWSLFDRVDFALRDAGFDLDEASDIAALAAAQESALAGAHTASGNAGPVRVDGEMFICYLIDKCESETITEESLHEWLADFLKNPRYHRPSAPAGSGEVDGLARWWQAVEDDMMRDGLSHPDHHVVVRYVGKHERADLTAGDIRAALLRKLQQGADGDE